jgi:2-polyprenyl-3-methyl-5-hydroxy-6-metoxy-1,4-benzoquinol methylase
MEAICSLCNKPLRIKLIRNIKRHDKIYDVYLCTECMVGSTVPTPLIEDLSRLYLSGSYRLYNGTRFYSAIEYFIYNFRLLRKRRIEKYVKRGHILDIGCGRGLFLNVMRKDDWGVTGVEFNRETALYASETYGIDVITETSLDELAGKSFDVITINHVLEHAYSPKELINSCKKLLRKGGLLVIAVPNIFSPQASVGKRVWFHLDLPYHLHHFSEEGLSTLLKKNSFNILKVKQFDLEYNPFGWLQTLLNLSCITENLLYNLLKSPELRKKEIPNVKKWDLILTFALLPLYVPLSLILSVFESLFLKRGGTIEVYAVKE